MNTVSATTAWNRRSLIRLIPIATPEPWQSAVLPLSSFPTPVEELGPVRAFVGELVRRLAASAPTVETFIQFESLHLADGASHVSRNGRQWMPMMGLGVWPDREPPKIWTVEEFQELVPGEKPRPLMNIALRVTGAREARHQARDVLVGRGTIIQLFANLDSEKLLANARELLLPPIQDPSFKAFPFYIPLLEAKSVSGASSHQLDAWSCGAHTYIRESVEDHGVLIVSKSLEEALRGLGAKLSETEPREWLVLDESYVSS
ncbi:MAG TPA: hypothetical protein VMB25_15440 [Bryobacteraceae bacterium]|nr:hypothetical protein [Bryobacteraceae bacterium]